jgi:hypothetical protein
LESWVLGAVREEGEFAAPWDAPPAGVPLAAFLDAGGGSLGAVFSEGFELRLKKPVLTGALGEPSAAERGAPGEQRLARRTSAQAGLRLRMGRNEPAILMGCWTMASRILA